LASSWQEARGEKACRQLFCYLGCHSETAINSGLYIIAKDSAASGLTKCGQAPYKSLTR